MCCGSVVQQSGQYVINMTDIRKVGKNTLIFMTPSLAVLAASLQGSLDLKYAAFAFSMNLVHSLIDLGRKFADTPS